MKRQHFCSELKHTQPFSKMTLRSTCCVISERTACSFLFHLFTTSGHLNVAGVDRRTKKTAIKENMHLMVTYIID